MNAFTLSIPHAAIERIRRKGYNTDKALIPTVSSFPPLDSHPPSAMHYKRLIMTVTAPQVCSMLDLLFSSQAVLSLPLTTCTGTLTRTHSDTHTQRYTHTHTHTHTHTRTYCSQLLCQRDSGAGERGGDITWISLAQLLYSQRCDPNSQFELSFLLFDLGFHGPPGCFHEPGFVYFYEVLLHLSGQEREDLHSWGEV